MPAAPSKARGVKRRPASAVKAVPKPKRTKKVGQESEAAEMPLEGGESLMAEPVEVAEPDAGAPPQNAGASLGVVGVPGPDAGVKEGNGEIEAEVPAPTAKVRKGPTDHERKQLKRTFA